MLEGTLEEVLVEISRDENKTPTWWDDLKDDFIEEWLKTADKSLVVQMTDAIIKEYFSKEQGLYLNNTHNQQYQQQWQQKIQQLTFDQCNNILRYNCNGDLDELIDIDEKEIDQDKINRIKTKDNIDWTHKSRKERK